MPEWPRQPVRELCSLIVDCVNRTAPVVEHETPYRMIRTTNVKEGRIDLSECRYVDEATFARWTRRAAVSNGDVILTREAPIGEVGYVKDLGPVFLGQRIMQYRPDPRKVVPRYLYYAFRSPDLRHQFGTHEGSGSVVSHIRVADCHEFKVSTPPLLEQDAIASLLGALDDKIELNRRMNETLEAMARAIFKDWFVDCGPTRAKMDDRAPYLSADVWSLFPDALDKDGQPQGWESFRLDQLAIHHTRGLTPLAAPDAEFEHFSLPAYDSGRSPALDRGSQIKSNKTLVPTDSILLSKLNPEIERVWIPEPAQNRRQICSTEFLAFTSTESSNRAILFGIFTDSGFRAMLHSMVTGTSNSHQRISPPNLLEREVLTASHVAISQYGLSAVPILEKIQANLAENRTLAATRDLLLPKLMSGEIRIKDAERIAGAAA